MAKYDTTKPERADLLRKYVERAIKNGDYVEAKKVDLKSLSLNGYFHVIIPYFALRLYRSYNWTREILVKTIICPDLFTEKRHDRNTGEECDHPLRWRDLDSHRAHLVVSRVLHYASIECDIRLPEPQDLLHPEVQKEINLELDQAKEFLY